MFLIPVSVVERARCASSGGGGEGERRLGRCSVLGVLKHLLGSVWNIYIYYIYTICIYVPPSVACPRDSRLVLITVFF